MRKLVIWGNVKYQTVVAKSKRASSANLAKPGIPGRNFSGPVSIDKHQENSKLLIFYLICLNPLNLKLSKIREEKRRGLDLFFLMFLNFFLILLKSTCCQLLLIFKKKLSAFKYN